MAIVVALIKDSEVKMKRSLMMVLFIKSVNNLKDEMTNGFKILNLLIHHHCGFICYLNQEETDRCISLLSVSWVTLSVLIIEHDFQLL